MIERNFLTPKEVACELVTVAENKVNYSIVQKIILGIIVCILWRLDSGSCVWIRAFHGK